MKIFPARNWRMMVLAFFLTLGIWFYLFCAREGISLVKPETKEISVLIKVFKEPGSAIQERVSPRVVTVEVKGPRDALRDLNSSRVRAFLDLKELGIGKGYQVPIQVDLPPEISLVSKDPRVALVDITLGWSPPGEPGGE